MLDIVSGEVLRTLMHEEATTAGVCKHIARFLAVDDDDGVARRIRSVLAELDDLGLIEPLPGC